MTFTSSDEEAADVVLKAYYPQDYTPYEDYLGTYYMYYREYENIMRKKIKWSSVLGIWRLNCNKKLLARALY